MTEKSILWNHKLPLVRSLKSCLTQKSKLRDRTRLQSIESARSVKGRNVQFNLRDAALALPGPALVALYERHGTTGDVGALAVVGVIYLFGLLKSLSTVLQVPLTKRTAGVLLTMWESRMEDGVSVPHDGLLEKVNSKFEEYRWLKITPEELVSHLETLQKLDCIERNNSFDSVLTEKISWRLRERVKVTY